MLRASCGMESALSRQAKGPFLDPKEALALFQLFSIRAFDLKGKQGSSIKLLSGFQQELEKSRRLPLHESSSAVAELLENNSSLRVARYKEAGCRHVHSDQQTIVKLNTFITGLQNHIEQAQKALAELRQLVEKVTSLTDLDSDVDSGICSLAEQNNCNWLQASHSKVVTVGEQQAFDYAMLMSTVFHMLEKDLQMQEMVVGDLTLDMDSNRLQAYCQMWDLHPFIDEEFIEEAVGGVN